MIAALPVLAIIGLRYPLKLLPLLFFEIVWKAIWLLAVALPLWTSRTFIGADTAHTIGACLMGAVFLIAIPWRYAFTTFVAQSPDRWR